MRLVDAHVSARPDVEIGTGTEPPATSPSYTAALAAELARLRSIEGAARALLTDDGPATTDRRLWDEFVAALASRP